MLIILILGAMLPHTISSPIPWKHHNDVNFCYVSGPFLWNGNCTMTSFTIHVSLLRKDDCTNPLEYSFVRCWDDKCQKKDYFQLPAVLVVGDIHSPSSCLLICQKSLHYRLWASIKTGRGSSSYVQRSELLITLIQHAVEIQVSSIFLES